MLDICLDYLSVISSDMLDISCLNTQFFFNIVEIERGKNKKNVSDLVKRVSDLNI